VTGLPELRVLGSYHRCPDTCSWEAAVVGGADSAHFHDMLVQVERVEN